MTDPKPKAPAKRASRSAFGPAKHKYLAKIVTIKTIPEAKVAVQKLWEEFRDTKTKKKKLTVARATNEAAVRCGLMMRKKDIHPVELSKLRTIQVLYSSMAKKMFAAYDKLKE